MILVCPSDACVIMMLCQTQSDSSDNGLMVDFGHVLHDDITESTGAREATLMKCLFHQPHFVINSLCVKFFRGKINIYLHFMSLLRIDMTQVPKSLSQVRPGPAYSTQSISWLLMSWRRKEPRHQQP